MRRAIVIIAAALLAALFAWPAAPALAEEAKPQVTEAKSYEIIDQDGNVLASHDATEHMAPASITKIMTAMVALDSGVDLDKTCTIQDMTYQDGAQLAGYKAGDAPTLRELMMAMLVYSANDAAANIAVAVSGSVDKFAELMNKKAQEIGMTNTQFKNPHGLEEDGHYSCAHDLALMGRYALENYPLIAAAVTTRSVTVTAGGQQKTLASTDDLMGSYAGLCGIKTGAVESGTTFLGSSRRWGVQLFSAVLGCSTHEGRFTDTSHPDGLGVRHLPGAHQPGAQGVAGARGFGRGLLLGKARGHGAVGRRRARLSRPGRDVAHHDAALGHDAWRAAAVWPLHVDAAGPTCRARGVPLQPLAAPRIIL
jgi:D-alanyl-D-alanine carboxypeptidase (penicillin-binding protein 5/6)